MILQIKVIPGARKNLYKHENGIVKVYLTAPPLEGRANEALCHFLAEHFDVRLIPGNQVGQDHVFRAQTVGKRHRRKMSCGFGQY